MPRPILELLDLLQALTSKSDLLESGPVRVEVDDRVLAGTGVPGALAELLGRAIFLAPRFHQVPSGELLARVAELAHRHEMYLDLDLPGLTDLADLPDVGALRTARLRMRTDEPLNRLIGDCPPLVYASWAAALVAGRTTLEVTAPDDQVPCLVHLVARLRQFDVRMDLEVIPRDDAARAALTAASQDIAEAARAHGINVAVKGGAGYFFGEALDPLAGWNVITASYRGVFRTRPSLCPFPFLMVRWGADGEIGVCPRPKGPRSGSVEADSWNAGLHRSVRRAFLDKEPPRPARLALCFLG